MTKSFTATAIVMLQWEGKLSFQDRICTFITACPKQWGDITIHHLLTNSSGLSLELSNQLYAGIHRTNGFLPSSERASYLGLNREWSMGCPAWRAVRLQQLRVHPVGRDHLLTDSQAEDGGDKLVEDVSC